MFSLFGCSYLSDFPGQFYNSPTLGEGLRLITLVCENNWLQNLIYMASEFRPIIIWGGGGGGVDYI